MSGRGWWPPFSAAQRPEKGLDATGSEMSGPPFFDQRRSTLLFRCETPSKTPAGRATEPHCLSRHARSSRLSTAGWDLGSGEEERTGDERIPTSVEHEWPRVWFSSVKAGCGLGSCGALARWEGTAAQREIERETLRSSKSCSTRRAPPRCGVFGSATWPRVSPPTTAAPQAFLSFFPPSHTTLWETRHFPTR